MHIAQMLAGYQVMPKSIGDFKFRPGLKTDCGEAAYLSLNRCRYLFSVAIDPFPF